jgi:hypothetical protein
MQPPYNLREKGTAVRRRASLLRQIPYVEVWGGQKKAQEVEPPPHEQRVSRPLNLFMLSWIALLPRRSAGVAGLRGSGGRW